MTTTINQKKQVMIYLKKENETKFKKIYLKRKKSQKNSNLLKKNCIKISKNFENKMFYVK